MMNKIMCVCCGKQAINSNVKINDPYCTTLIGARAGFYKGECYCGHCAKHMDENGNFFTEINNTGDYDYDE